MKKKLQSFLQEGEFGGLITTLTRKAKEEESQPSCFLLQKLLLSFAIQAIFVSPKCFLPTKSLSKFKIPKS